MRRGTHSGPLLSEGLLRGMALFFLLFTLADTVFPPPCSDDCTTHSSVSATGANDTMTVNATALVANDDPCPNRSPDRQCGDEDCCFGCAHMLSINAITGVVVFRPKVPQRDSIVRICTSTSTSTYRSPSTVCLIFQGRYRTLDSSSLSFFS